MTPARFALCSLPGPALPCPALPCTPPPPHAALLSAWLGLAPLRPPPPLLAALTRLVPISLSFAASLFLGNVAYLGLSGEGGRGSSGGGGGGGRWRQPQPQLWQARGVV